MEERGWDGQYEVRPQCLRDERDRLDEDHARAMFDSFHCINLADFFRPPGMVLDM